ncbi:MAG TPA: glycosyltransferase [Gaiellaceae bacterium]|nr:glycosyltransferase [Gaiellaceae bacterium]
MVIPDPIKLHEVEIGRSLPSLPTVNEETGRRYRRGLSLVRLHTYPLGMVELTLSGDELTPADYAAQIWDAFGLEISAHLEADGLPQPSQLSEAGLPSVAAPACQHDRNLVLSNAPSVSVVVPTRDGGARLGPCLDSLLACSYPSERREIVVVDNVPKTSKTADFLHAEFGDQVRYLREDVAGSASARNRGLAAASGEIVAFIDDDAVADRYWLVELAKAFSLNPDVACVTQLILPAELEWPAQLWFEEYGGATKGFARRVFDMHANRPDDPLFPFNAGRFGSGGSMAFKRVLLERLGGFDPALGNGTPALGGVDLEVFFRTLIEGYTLVYEPAAIVRHRHLRDAAELRDRVYAYGVGLSAFVLRSLVAKPSLIPSLIRRLPQGLHFALAPSSAKNTRKSPSYPGELRRAELKGMLYGPIAYAISATRFGWPVRVSRER